MCSAGGRFRRLLGSCSCRKAARRFRIFSSLSTSRTNRPARPGEAAPGYFIYVLPGEACRKRRCMLLTSITTAYGRKDEGFFGASRSAHVRCSTSREYIRLLVISVASCRPADRPARNAKYFKYEYNVFSRTSAMYRTEHPPKFWKSRFEYRWD